MNNMPASYVYVVMYPKRIRTQWLRSVRVYILDKNNNKYITRLNIYINNKYRGEKKMRRSRQAQLVQTRDVTHIYLVFVI